MADILIHPAFQSGIAPFIVALAVALLLLTTTQRAGLSIIAGFATVLALTVGFNFDPLTSTRKIILLGLGSAVLAMLLPRDERLSSTALYTLVALIATSAVLWVLWPALSRKGLVEALTLGTGLVIFSVWLAVSLLTLRTRPAIAAGPTLAALAFGVGGSALIGASALYGQMGIAIGASALAFTLAYVLFDPYESTGSIPLLIGAVVLALIAPASVVYAKVPWVALLFLAMVPPVAHLKLGENLPFVARAFVWFIVGMVPAGISLAIVLQSAGPVPL